MKYRVYFTMAPQCDDEKAKEVSFDECSALAAVVFGDWAAMAWFLSPHPLFDGELPVVVCATPEGCRTVYAELQGIQRGGY